jgi:hypothetical protein
MEQNTDPNGETESLSVGRDEQQAVPVLEHPGPDDVDEGRFARLEQKRREEGLTHGEANELGRMIAAREGKPYSNAQAREHPESLPEPESAPAGHESAASPRRIPGDPDPDRPPDEDARDLAR